MINDLVDGMDFEARMSGMADRQLLEFVARQTVATCKRCENHNNHLLEHNNRLLELETGAKKTSSLAGAITGGLAGAIIGIINYFAGRS